MTTQEIKTKIKELEDWLKKANPNHPNYGLVLKDKQDLERQLEELKPTKKQ